MNSIFVHCVIITLICFLFNLFYYNLLFRTTSVMRVSNKKSKENHPYTNQFSIFLATCFSLFASALVYSTLGVLTNLFSTAHYVIPYMVSGLLWILVAAGILVTAMRNHDPAKMTLLHLGYWLVVLSAFSVYFPPALQNINF